MNEVVIVFVCAPSPVFELCLTNILDTRCPCGIFELAFQGHGVSDDVTLECRQFEAAQVVTSMTPIVLPEILGSAFRQYGLGSVLSFDDCGVLDTWKTHVEARAGGLP